MRMKRTLMAFVMLAFALAVAAPVIAEDSPQAKPETKEALRTELIRLKYLKTGASLHQLINAYLSREGHLAEGPAGSIIVVSDHPENVESILQVIRLIDVKPAELVITVQLVLGSEVEEKGADPIGNDPVIKELRNLLKYKSYSLLDTSMVRAMDNNDAEVRMGNRGDFEFSVMPRVIRDEKSTLVQMWVRLRQVREDPRVAAGLVEPAKGDRTATDLITTNLNIKPGDKTVVGVSKLDGGGKGLILIISGKIVD
ncbi:MAG: hypothetical protein ABFD80_08825 [Acidobacteriota bacterium]